MPRLVLDFSTREDLDNWYGAYSDGGGYDAIYDCIEAQDDVDIDNFTFPTITEEL